MRRSREVIGEKEKGRPVARTFSMAISAMSVELAVAGGLEAFGVEGDAVVIFGFEAKDLGGEVLDGVEKFAVTGEQERSVGAGEFDCDFGTGGDWIEEAVGSPAGSLELGCTWPLQARMLDFRFRPPGSAKQSSGSLRSFWLLGPGRSM